MPKIDLRQIINDDVIEVTLLDGSVWKIADVPVEFILAMSTAKEVSQEEFARYVEIALREQGMTPEKARKLGFLELTGLFRAIVARFFEADSVLDKDPTLARSKRFVTPPTAPTGLRQEPEGDSTGSGPSPDSSAPTPVTPSPPASG